MPPWGRPSLHWLRTPFPLRGWGVLRERPCHAPREGGRTVRWGGSRPRALRSAWRPCARSLWALAGGAALTSSTDTPIPRARGGGRAGSAGRTYGRTGTEGRAHRQAMPGEAARAELLLPEAGEPGPRTGEAPRFPPREASPPLRPAQSPLHPLPVVSARCPSMHRNADPRPVPRGRAGAAGEMGGPGRACECPGLHAPLLSAPELRTWVHPGPRGHPPFSCLRAVQSRD